MFELCCSAVFYKEDTTIYQKFYKTLRINYSFKPKKITPDFSLPNINSVYKVYNDIDIEILPCLFHLVQAWWRKANKLDLRKKDFIKNTQTIIF